MRPAVAASIVLVILLGAAPVAHADLTLFAGTNVTPSNRPVRGFAVGLSLLIVGFEFEYSDTTADEMAAAPRLRSGMFNMHVQTPFGVAGLQFYGTAGGGLFREEGSSLAGNQRRNQLRRGRQDLCRRTDPHASGLSRLQVARRTATYRPPADLRWAEHQFLNRRPHATRQSANPPARRANARRVHTTGLSGRRAGWAP